MGDDPVQDALDDAVETYVQETAEGPVIVTGYYLIAAAQPLDDEMTEYSESWMRGSQPAHISIGLLHQARLYRERDLLEREL